MFNSHFREFLELLEKRKVKYLLVGGYAVGIHGFPRYTGDMDVFIAVSADNAKKVVKTFEDFGFDSLGLKAGDFLEPNGVVEIGREPMKIQVLTGIDGVTFEQCFRKRIYFKDAGLKVAVIGYEELIQNKLATTRSKDKIDAQELQKIKPGAKNSSAITPAPAAPNRLRRGRGSGRVRGGR